MDVVYGPSDRCNTGSVLGLYKQSECRYQPSKVDLVGFFNVFAILLGSSCLVILSASIRFQNISTDANSRFDIHGYLRMGSSHKGSDYVPFKNNGNLRVIQDYRPVNSVTVKPQWSVYFKNGVFCSLIQGEYVFFHSNAAHKF